MARVVFFSNQLGLRGTEIALYDYAKYNQSILGNESIVLSYRVDNEDVLGKFRKEFPTFVVGAETLERDTHLLKPDVFYKICSGRKEKLPNLGCKSAIHAVF